MGHGRFLGLEERHHFADIEVVIAQGDIDLVQQDEPHIRVTDHAFGGLPPGPGRCDIAVAVLGFPGEAFA